MSSVIASVIELTDRVLGERSDLSRNWRRLEQRAEFSDKGLVGAVYAAAGATASAAVADAAERDARAVFDEDERAQLRALAATMTMNNVGHRAKHFLGFERHPFGMRSKATTEGPLPEREVWELAVSAVNGCEVCLREHAERARGAGLTDDGVWHAVTAASLTAALAHAARAVEAARRAEG